MKAQAVVQQKTSTQQREETRSGSGEDLEVEMWMEQNLWEPAGANGVAQG